mmetsp:Transcript_6212/g.9275  ORF Transcript_6212/g.9275 Transcript_6212/m.9275 type:complete len:536 (-) Transcript_6212:697-2304(-)
MSTLARWRTARYSDTSLKLRTRLVRTITPRTRLWMRTAYLKRALLSRMVWMFLRPRKPLAMRCNCTAYRCCSRRFRIITTRRRAWRPLANRWMVRAAVSLRRRSRIRCTLLRPLRPRNTRWMRVAARRRRPSFTRARYRQRIRLPRSKAWILMTASNIFWYFRRCRISPTLRRARKPLPNPCSRMAAASTRSLRRRWASSWAVRFQMSQLVRSHRLSSWSRPVSRFRTATRRSSRPVLSSWRAPCSCQRHAEKPLRRSARTSTCSAVRIRSTPSLNSMVRARGSRIFTSSCAVAMPFLTRMVWLSMRLRDPSSSEVRLAAGSCESLFPSPGRGKSLVRPLFVGWWVGGNRVTEALEEGRAAPTAGNAEEVGRRFLVYADSSEGSAEASEWGDRVTLDARDSDEPTDPLRCSRPPGSDVCEEIILLGKPCAAAMNTLRAPSVRPSSSSAARRLLTAATPRHSPVDCSPCFQLAVCCSTEALAFWATRSASFCSTAAISERDADNQLSLSEPICSISSCEWPAWRWTCVCVVDCTLN